jgi:hypothetical protein
MAGIPVSTSLFTWRFWRIAGLPIIIVSAIVGAFNLKYFFATFFTCFLFMSVFLSWITHFEKRYTVHSGTKEYLCNKCHNEVYEDDDICDNCKSFLATVGITHKNN